LLACGEKSYDGHVGEWQSGLGMTGESVMGVAILRSITFAGGIRHVLFWSRLPIFHSLFHFRLLTYFFAKLLV
jgi:hypothetical protein